MSERQPRELTVEAIRRGDVVWVDCDPSVGAEPAKLRTCVVVSNDIANRFGRAVSVIPTQRFTQDRAERAYMVDLRKPRSTLRAHRVANASMIMTYDKRRIAKKAGATSKATQAAIDQALKIHLALDLA